MLSFDLPESGLKKSPSCNAGSLAVASLHSQDQYILDRQLPNTAHVLDPGKDLVILKLGALRTTLDV